MTKIIEIEAPRIFPTLRCRDTEAMVNWLKDVCGFTEYVVYRGDGAIRHTELAYGSSIVMLGQSRDDDYGRLVGDLGGRRTLRCRQRSGRVARQSQGCWRQNRDGTARYRLWQPRLCLPGSGRQSLELRHLLAEGA
jgi:hypothetical protein